MTVWFVTDPVHHNNNSHDRRHVDAWPDGEAEHVVFERRHRPGRHAGGLPRYPCRLLAVAATTDLAVPPGEGALDPVGRSGGLRVLAAEAR